MASIQGIYIALFGRPADPNGLAYFNSITKNGADLSVIGDLASTQEYKDRFAGQTNTTIINSIYQSLFGRDAENAGLNFFVDALNKGTLNIKNIAIGILDGAQGSDKTILGYKIAAADLFTAALDTPSEIGSYTGSSAASQGRAFLSGVTSSVPDIVAVDASIKSMADALSVGNTLASTAFTTVATPDTINVGTGAANTTDKNDTLNALTTNTWNPATDTIDGGFGNDTLNAQINGITGATGTVQANGLKSIEILSVTNITAASTIDVSNAKELQQIWDNISTKALTFNNVSLSTTVGLKGSIVEATTFNFADASGSNDSASLTVNAATSAVGVSIAAIETLNISNAGTSNIGTVTAVDAANINLTGTGALSFVLANGAATTVTNNSTAAVTADLTAASKVTTYNGGASADVVTIDTSHKANQTISLGAGVDQVIVQQSGAPVDFSITITGGAGSDLFKFGDGIGDIVDNVKSIDSAANLTKSLITITDFDKGADTIFVDASANSRVALTNFQTGALAAASDIKTAASLAASYTNGTHIVVVFAFGGDAYIYVDADHNSTLSQGDGLIKVAGVTNLSDFTSANLQIA